MINRIIIYYFILLSWGYAQPGLGCKIKSWHLKPIISMFNPYCQDQTWDPKTYTQTAYMGDVKIEILQSGCDRHHVSFRFQLPLPDTTQALTQAPDYWPKRVYTWLDRCFETQKDWLLFREPFYRQLLRYFDPESFVGLTYNFPVQERNFFYYSTQYDSIVEIKLEIVRYLYSEQINTPGLPLMEDDGFGYWD
ncbi:MAG: hypothetical protein EBS07_05950 [Sphingobacteriia bacterium]|nr:hypothetical protein [Sphingobacteriia bacterium]